MVARSALLVEVERALGDRRLVWAGLRGDDIEPLADLPQLRGSFSIIGGYSRRAGVESQALEDLTGERVDPEIWDIDDQPHAATSVAFRRSLLGALAGRSALLPYRPSQFLSGVYFSRLRHCVNLGLSGAQQSAFDHKPWVESAVAAMDLPRMPWRYISDEEQFEAEALGRDGSIVLRRSRTSGGQGFVHVSSPDEIRRLWPRVDEAFVSVAPFLEGGLPLNIGATVWRDVVTLHHPSIQLIGIPSCTTREFGYCGNDFGLVRDLDLSVLDQVEASTLRIGNWLRSQGYLGSFGVDFLLHRGEALFMEVNPRFQGSTLASCRLSIEEGEACLMLEHVGAWLGLAGPEPVPLRQRVAATPDLASVVVHWTGQEGRHVKANELTEQVRQVDPRVRCDVLVPPATLTHPGATVGRFMMRRRITESGFALDPALDGRIARWQRDASAGTDVEASR